MPVDQAAHIIIADRLKRAGEFVYARGRPDHPAFKSAGIAAANLLRLVPPALPLLVMRDQCLRPLRELVLASDRTLLVPSKHGTDVVRIPRSALFGADGMRTAQALRIDPLPAGSAPYAGPVGAVVVACLAFDPRLRRLYSFDTDRTACILDELRDGLPGGFTLSSDVPVVALAHDLQEVAEWPAAALGFARADFVVTPLRCFVLGTAEVQSFVTHGSSVPVGGMDDVQPNNE